MERDSEQLNLEFNNRARSVFFNLYNTFKQGVAPLDRLRDENVFQQLQSQYVQSLRQQLEHIAKEILARSKTPQQKTQFAQRVPALISDYTTEFTQKIRGL
jgi:phosphoglycerate-specific signal transduction histidine kinase